LLNYFSELFIDKDTVKGRTVFYSAVVLNAIPLIFFKYYNFFIGSVNDTFSVMGIDLDLQTLKLVLPVGISFYTFLSLSYLIDVYKKQILPEKNIVDYALAISYFPITMAGPIHRPKIFLDQLKKEIKFDYNLAAEGLRQILTGLLMKVVIADSIAKHVNTVFNGYEKLNGITLILGLVYFSFQLYFDFGGYSEMAIGISKLLGYRISRNFRFPYLARTIPDFWKRWHISLTEWFRDYIFLPLSYILSRKMKQDSLFGSDIVIYSIGALVTWTLTGLWHGAGWNFVLWGMVHAIFLIISKAFIKPKKKLLKRFGLKKDSAAVIIYEYLLTFSIVNFAWIFFRNPTASKSFGMLSRIADVYAWSRPEITLLPLMMIVIMISLEFIQREKEFLIDIPHLNIFLRWIVYIGVTLTVIYYSGNETTFIYAGF